MDIVQKLIDLGICEGGPADILMSSKKQIALINDFGIDLKAPNNGHHVFSTPVMGFSSNPNLGGTSLQIGVFNLLQFRKLIPLLPSFDESRPDRLVIGLYSLSEELYDLEALVKLYKVDQVYAEFNNMPDASKVAQQVFMEEFERKKAVARKASASKSDFDATSDGTDTNILVEEVCDEELMKLFTNK